MRGLTTTARRLDAGDAGEAPAHQRLDLGGQTRRVGERPAVHAHRAARPAPLTLQRCLGAHDLRVARRRLLGERTQGGDRHEDAAGGVGGSQSPSSPCRSTSHTSTPRATMAAASSQARRPGSCGQAEIPERGEVAVERGRRQPHGEQQRHDARR